MEQYIALAQETWVSFDALAESWSRQAVSWAHPNFPYDERPTAGWPLTRLSSALAISVVYLVLVAYGLIRRGSKSEDEDEKGKPLGFFAGLRKEPIKLLQIVYNTAQVALCTWMMVSAALEAKAQNFSLVCNKFDPRDARMATIEYVFYLSKVLDFADTVFIIARGKWKQLSFLHYYHHVSIFMIYWLVTVAAYDGDVYYTIIANSLVHAAMYFYYLCTCFNVRPWWGRHLTQLQMIQFITMNAQAIYILVNGCPYPGPLTAFYLAYILSLFALFMNFYLKRWSPSPKSGVKSKLPKKVE